MNQLPQKFYVYVHCLASNGQPFYVGKGCGDRAWRSKNRNHRWHKAVETHGLVVDVVSKNLDNDLALLAEAELIDKYRRLKFNLVYICNGGSVGPVGWQPSPETRAKLSAANMGTNNPNYGKARSEATKQKISQAQKGKFINFESRLKMSLSRKGMKLASDTKRKMSETALLRPRLLCPHCNFLATAAMAKRWHFDNCKMKGA